MVLAECTAGVAPFVNLCIPRIDYGPEIRGSLPDRLLEPLLDGSQRLQETVPLRRTLEMPRHIAPEIRHKVEDLCECIVGRRFRKLAEGLFGLVQKTLELVLQLWQSSPHTYIPSATESQQRAEPAHSPFCNQLGQDLAQALCQVRRPEVTLILGVELRPDRCRREVLALLTARVCPGDAFLECLRVGLLHAEPPVLERLVLVFDEARPVLFFAQLDAVRLGEHADGALPFGVVLLRDVVRALILEVRCGHTLQ